MEFMFHDNYVDSTLAVRPRFEGTMLHFSVASSLSNGIPHGPTLPREQVIALRDALNEYLGH